MTTKNWFYSLSVLVIIMSFIDIEGLTLAFWAVYAIKMVIEDAIVTYADNFNTTNNNTFAFNVPEINDLANKKVDETVKNALRNHKKVVIPVKNKK